MRTTSRPESDFLELYVKNSQLVFFYDEVWCCYGLSTQYTNFQWFWLNEESSCSWDIFSIRTSSIKVLYEKNIFSIVQNELFHSIYSCSHGTVSIVEGHDVYVVLEQSLGQYGENWSMFF